MATRDIILLLTEDGRQWEKFVTGQLNQFPRVTHSCLVLDDLEYENPPEVTQACQESAVILMLVTAQFLDFLEEKVGWFSRALRCVPTTTDVILFVLLEESETSKLRDVTHNNYHGDTWHVLDPGYDMAEVRRSLATVLDIAEQCQVAKKAVLTRQIEASHRETEPVPKQKNFLAELTEVFSGNDRPTPKKRSVQPPVASVKTQEEEQEVSTSGDDQGGVSVGFRKKTLPSTSTKPKNSVKLFPSVIHEIGQRVALVMQKPVEGEVTVKFERTNIELTAEQENEKVFCFETPQLPPGKHNMIINENGKRLCRSSVIVRGAEISMFTSPAFLCQAVGVTSTADLDLRLKDVFVSSLPLPGSGLDVIFHNLKQESQPHSESLYPTLLHFAAAHGLSELCAALLDCPASSHAFNIRNCEGQDPAEMASNAGFEELEIYISEFMEIQTAKEIYDHYIAMHPSFEQGSDSGSDYEEPRRVMPPGQRSRSISETGISTNPSAPPVHQRAQLSPPTFHSDSRQMEHKEGPSTSDAEGPPLPPRSKDMGRSMSQRHASSPSCLQSILEGESRETTPSPLAQSLRPNLPGAALGSLSQNELIEMNEMVKNNEITLNQAHMFFNSWKQRFSNTPSSSFKERRKELSEIKSEYQKTREKLKENKPSKGLLSRLGLGGRQSKPTVKLHISEPVAQRQKKSRVFTKSASTSQLWGSGDRVSSTSSSASSRDSGWSQGSRDSAMSRSFDTDSEAKEEGDEVFQQHDAPLRARSTRGSKNRVSLGFLYLQQTENDSQGPQLPPRQHARRLPPPPPPSSSPP